MDEVGAEAIFLGRGWSFPPEFSPEAGVLMVAGKDDIRQSLLILFSTIRGERVMLPDYGCNLVPKVFDVINATTLTEIGELIRKAVLFHEPRIDVVDIVFLTDRAAEGIIEVAMTYSIKGTNSRNNIVYPFYLREGNNVRAI